MTLALRRAVGPHGHRRDGPGHQRRNRRRPGRRFPALWAALFAIDEKGRLLKGVRLQTILVLGFLFLGLARWVGQREPFLMVVADFLVAFCSPRAPSSKQSKTSNK
ncbi:MAG: hypothetical protein IPN23_11175 [Elusimicrobia bacterium]|nr:hypothetical protein [Elusimicrobiota bacterium]